MAANLNAYVPFVGAGMHLALRGGGIRAFGDYAALTRPPLAARSTLRGFDARRWAGDAAAYGGAELRVPLGGIAWIVPGEVRVLGLDAGRAWVEGRSRGGWHTGYGASMWFETFGHVVSAAFAKGERDKPYLRLGLPY
jgi:hypothetical protein